MTPTPTEEEIPGQPPPSKTKNSSNFFVRVATIDDVKHAPKMTSIINSAYKSDDGWTSNKNIIKGDRTTLQNIYACLRRSDETSSAFMCAFTKRDPSSDSSKKADETAVGTVMIDPMTDSNGNDHYCIFELFAVNPADQSKSVGAQIMYAAMAQAKKMGYEAAFLKILDKKTKLRSWVRI
ncbi:hypothetical protein BDB00DRAFT_815846 [Zychaea mexicana]|uniref:uncharacterized protein n=1 Tax=Zychaea mexicana TaxID=64656 RepID=UPI0022FEDA81|nr:uncharacterized protein BDB00DRAFT_815846 [Zychaea mexicana]KAI9495097.1 hypothetical protein BDB00DRAFT_815846 [Zychaea mexicana]